MSCIFRASGKNFDIDLFVKDKDLEFTQLYKKGDPRFPQSKPEGPKLEFSGLGIEVSDADFDSMGQQLEDALAFLRMEVAFIQELVKFPGVEYVSLDFGVETKPPFLSSYTFPHELVAAVGNLGLSLCVSTYPNDDEDDVDDEI